MVARVVWDHEAAGSSPVSPTNSMEQRVKNGRYKHYKGGFYKVLGLATHSEIGEELVVYQSELDNRLWVRPKGMFIEKVVVGGKEVPRFKKI